MMKAEQDFKDNNLRKAYKGINLFKKGYQPNTTFCKTQTGELIAKQEGVLDR